MNEYDSSNNYPQGQWVNPYVPPGGGASGNGGGASFPGGVTPRNIVTAILLTLVTCGIYGLYWLYCLANDTKELSGETEGMSGGMVVLLSIVTCSIFLWYWLFKQGQWVDEVRMRRGLPGNYCSILYLVLALFGFSIVSLALLQHEINNMLS